MVMPDVVFSLIVAVTVSLVAARIICRQGPRKGLFWYFLVVFLATWAGGIWSKPPGAAWSEGWFAFVGAGVLAAGMLLLVRPKARKVGREAQLDREQTMAMIERMERKKEISELTYITINIIFFIAVTSLLLVIAAHYFIRQS